MLKLHQHRELIIGPDDGNFVVSGTTRLGQLIHSEEIPRKQNIRDFVRIYGILG
jgi:hypothetical protein